jgi:hypothetical protein
MMEPSPYSQALSAFLASDTFLTIVRDDLGQEPAQPRVLALLPDGKYTVYSGRQDAPHTHDVVLLDIPAGAPEVVERGLRAELARLQRA